MATLEKIRSKSVFLIVVIALALLAFILGDAITNGRNLFGSTTTVAEIDGRKIDISDYQRKHQELASQLEDARKQNPGQYAGFDNQVLAQQAVEELVDEVLLREAIEKTGIRPSAEQLRFFMLEYPQPIPEMQRLLQAMNAQGMAVQTAQQAYNVIFNPAQAGLTEKQMAPWQREWMAVESRYKQLVSQLVYGNLLGSTFKANDLDRAAMKNDYVSVASVKVASKPYGRVDEKKYPVSDAELKQAWDADKSEYSVDEQTKDINFIAVRIVPSAADNAAASELASRTVAELRKGSEISKTLRKEGIAVERHSLRGSDIRQAGLKAFVSSAPADSVALVQSNAGGFQIAKMGSRAVEVDSIQLSVVAVAGKALPARVLSALQSCLPADSLAKRFAADSVMVQPAQWVPLYTAQGKTPVSNLGISQANLDSLMNNGGSYIALNSTDDGTLYAAVTKKSTPKEIYTYETVDYELHPSEATIAEARAQLEKFISTNSTAAKFAAEAAKAGYNMQNFLLTASSPAVPVMTGMNRYYPDSRPVVRWVMMDAGNGEVSKIYQSKDNAAPVLYVAALNATYDDYIPWNNADVKKALTAKVRNSKAGDDMVKQYSGKGSVDAVAQAMGVTANDIAKFRFSRGAVADQKVIGRIMGTKPSGKVVVVKGDDGVYAFTVSSSADEKFPVDDTQLDQMFGRMHQMNPSKVLRGAKKLNNNIYKFEQGE